ncbi:hypothetical protein PVAND_015237 [Polypedilum vanderplanki]|uniref:Odorant receptor n=1 Tax=Polypedilum vanderplanki TaxID=319348 RepID=A0A9J6BC66_POLVA|nr:hypothetical protein PVAND_015237 [Polypedilum vanderplanki]
MLARTKVIFKEILPIKSENFEVLKPLDLPIKILKINGNWPTKNSSKKYLIYCIILHLLVMEIGTILQLLYLPHVENFFDFTQLVTILPSCIAVCIETFVVYFYKNELLAVMEMIKDVINEHGMSEKLKTNLLFVDKYMRILLLLMIVSTSAFTISGIYYHQLSYKMWFPFEINFCFAIIYQICCLYNYSLVNLVLDILPVFFIVYTVGMLEQLCDNLENIKKSTKGEENRQKLINCIEYHCKIIEINKKIQKIFSPIFLARGFLSVAVLCTAIFAILTLSDPAIFGKLVAYVIIMTVTIFVPCYYGSKLKEISSQVSVSLFQSEWIYEDQKYQELVKIMIINTGKSLKISIADVFDVDLANFMSICHSVYSAYCICNRMSSGF